MDLASLADFHASARFGSFSEASRRTETPKATISRRVRRLEATLGVQLFERGTRSLRLTEDGRALLARTDALLGDLTTLAEELAERAGRPQGRLRLSAPSLFAQAHLGAVAARFVDQHPGVRLEVEVQDHFADLHEDDFDLVIRARPDPLSRLVGRQLYTQPILVVAAPHIDRPTVDGASIAAVTLLTWPIADEWTFVGDDGRTTVRPQPVLRFSSPIPVCDAVLAGAGAGALPLSLAERHIADGRLVEWGRLEGRQAEVWALHTEGRPQSAKVAALTALLVDHFSGCSSAEGGVEPD